MSRNRWLALTGVAIASFLGCIDFTIVNTAIPDIQQSLGADIDRSQWIVSSFVMALSACMVAAGRLADLHGRRRIMLIGMAVFGLASLGAGLANGMATLIAWRVVQGMACATLYTASTAIVAHAFSETERGRAIGLLFSANGLGLAIGPVIGGLLVAAAGWRWVFLVNVPLILVGMALCLRHVEESRGADEHETLDVAGLVLLAVALTALLLAIAEGGKWGWTSIATLTSAAVALLALLALSRVESRMAYPLIRIDLFANRRFLLASLATATLACFYCAAFFLMPLYLGQIRHQDAAAIGLLLLPTTAVMALVSPQIGKLVDQIGTTWALAAGFVCLTISALLQAGFGPDTAWWQVLAAFAAMGIGWGAILGPSTVAALASVPTRLGGVAMGASWTLHNLGGAIGLALATVIHQTVSGATRAAPDVRFLAGYGASMWLLAGLSAGVAVLLVLGRSRS
ncbi:MFS transporter [Pigmentiphaga aceris]|uniref:MFS transporter n=1 Tax=Pigmentiphaga aceris TaxID=1940612 RepID=A0A5C0B5M6_9BURK|nr:MFS transporter [Pigmentiphaga aceris]